MTFFFLFVKLLRNFGGNVAPILLLLVLYFEVPHLLFLRVVERIVNEYTFLIHAGVQSILCRCGRLLHPPVSSAS